MPKQCPVCQKEIEQSQLFCSRLCSNKSRTKKVIWRQCKHCCIAFPVSQNQRKATYCSLRCKKDAALKRHSQKSKKQYVYKFTETEFAKQHTIDKTKYSSFTCKHCLTTYYIFTTLLKRHRNFCSLSCRSAACAKEPNKAKRSRYNKAIHKCSYTQFKYLSSLLCHAKCRALAKNRICSISVLDLIDVLLEQNFLCPFTKLPLEFISSQNNPFTASIDRIDSSIGYTKENIQLVTLWANRAKNNLPTDLFVSLCKKVGV